MRNFLVATGFLAFSLLLSNCGGSKKDDEDQGRVIESMPFLKQTAVDTDPDMSDDGSKVVFVSYRETVPKVFKFADGVLSRVTKSEWGQELRGRVSPDGTLIALLVRDPEGVSRIVLYTWQGELLGELPHLAGLLRFEDMSFSQDSSALVYQALSNGNGEKQHVIVYTKILLGPETSFVDLVISTDEWEPKLSRVDDVQYLVTRGIDREFNSVFRTYIISESQTPTVSLVKTSPPVSASSGALLGVGASGIYYKENLVKVRVKERLGDREPQNGVSSRGFVGSSTEVSNLGLTLDSSALRKSDIFRSYEPTETYYVQQVDEDTLGILGGDYYICNNGALYLNTYLFYNFRDQLVIPISFAKDKDSEQFDGLLTDICSGMIANEGSARQPFERKIRKAIVKGSFQEGFYMVVESWDSQDGDIFHIEFKLSRPSEGGSSNYQITNQEVTDISSYQAVE